MVGLFCAGLQLGFEKIIQPACQLLPAPAQVGVPPVNAFAVLLDMQIVTQLFRPMASDRARAMSLENWVVTATVWLRTINSLKLGSPIAKIKPRTTRVTISSMIVNPAQEAHTGIFGLSSGENRVVRQLWQARGMPLV